MYKAGRIILAACIVLGVLVSSVCLGAEVSGDNSGVVMEFQLLNSTGMMIREIWVGPSGHHNCFGRRDHIIRDGSPLQSGNSRTISVDLKGHKNVRYWDIRVYTNDGKKHEWHNIDLMKYYQVEIDRRYTAHFSRK